MRIIAINAVNIGSTGSIMLGIGEIARKEGHKYYSFSAPGRSMRKNVTNHMFVGTILGHHIHMKLAQITGLHGFFSIFDTFLFCKKMDRIHPELIHLHNLHNCYINFPLLFGYIKKHNIPVVWTLHDCWTFTGHCPHFTISKCTKWITGCYDCSCYKHYPKSYFDDSKKMWKLKKKYFTGIKKLTIVTPSQWLAELVKKSFLQEYPVKVIHNGIDLNVFQPTKNKIRELYDINEDQMILLGVAFGWNYRKGLDVFTELAKRLDDNYKIILVGTNEEVDKQLPDNIISIHRTDNQKQLAEIYSAADLFLNPTREEVLGLVNIEALACGTPVITFQTGGSPECINSECGEIVPCDNIDIIEKEIKKNRESRNYSERACIKQASLFDKNVVYEEYIKVYKEITT